MVNQRIGLDIGGTGVKGAVVDLDKGTLSSARIRRDTPRPATPDAVADVVVEVIGEIQLEGPVGIGFPAVLRDGVVFTANNIDPSWIGVDAGDLFKRRLGTDVEMINDADAAGLAEVAYGVAREREGLVIVLTFGTGIGSGLFVDGRLVPNTELGQLELSGASPAESFYSAKARQSENLGWLEWGERANEFLSHVNDLFSPDLIVLGGGAAKRWDQFSGAIDSCLPLKPAELLNNAGIVGAACLVRG